MRAYGTRIVGGVSPYSDVDEVDGVAIFRSCAEAVSATGAKASVVMVPPLAVLAAIREAISAGIRLIVTIAEGMPVADAVVALEEVHAAGVRWIGPSTPGLAIPGVLKLGFLPNVSLAPGTLGVMAKSGTLSYEVCHRLVDRGFGQSLWVGVGGDAVKGTRFADILPFMLADPKTRGIVVIGEIGGSEEEELAATMIALRCTKPVFALIAGRTAREGIMMGHAGALILGNVGTVDFEEGGPCRCRRPGFYAHPGTGRRRDNRTRTQSGRKYVLLTLSEEQHRFVHTVRDLTQKEFKGRALKYLDGTFPWENMRQLAKLGVLGMAVPEEYGGLGLPVLDTALVLEEIAKGCYVTAMAVLGEVGTQTRIIATYAPEHIKRRILPAVCSGECILAICMTEPDAGTDVANYRTNADICGDRICLNGVKTLISRAEEAGMFVVFARINKRPGREGIGCVLVEKGTPGLAVTGKYHTMGGEFLCEVRFENCELPLENLVVREDGFRRLLNAFNTQRCLNPSISLGLAEAALDESVRYMRERKRFRPADRRISGHALEARRHVQGY